MEGVSVPGILFVISLMVLLLFAGLYYATHIPNTDAIKHPFLTPYCNLQPIYLRPPFLDQQCKDLNHGLL